MAYELTFTLSLGTSNTGIADLRAQLFDDAGTDVGSAVASGFTEIGQGFYLWNYASIPDDHRGGVKFYRAAASSTFLSAASINPEEAEYADVKTTTRSSHNAAAVWASGKRELTGFGTLVADIWAAATSGLTAAGSIGKLLVDNIDAAISSVGGATVAQLWGALTSGLATTNSIGKLLVSKLNLITGPLESASSATRDFAIIRAVTFTHETSTLVVPGSWTECYVTSKCDLDDLDSAALFQIKITNGGDAGDGLQVLNGVAQTGAALSNGSVTVNADTVSFTLADDASAELTRQTGAHYDVKFLLSDGTTNRQEWGVHDVEYTATRTV